MSISTRYGITYSAGIELSSSLGYTQPGFPLRIQYALKVTLSQLKGMYGVSDSFIRLILLDNLIVSVSHFAWVPAVR